MYVFTWLYDYPHSCGTEIYKMKSFNKGKGPVNLHNQNYVIDGLAAEPK